MTMTQSLETGKKAPAFALETDTDGLIRLSALKGKIVVLYFYPKDDTPGCTTQAVNFTAELAKFKRAGAVIIGVSKDTITKHGKFRDKHELKVLLGSDPEGATIEKYGVWVEKNMYGRKYMGIERSTFLIDQKGVIREIWRKVKVKGHVEEVLAAVKALPKE